MSAEDEQMLAIKQTIDSLKKLAMASHKAMEVHAMRHAAICKAVERADEFLKEPCDETYEALAKASVLVETLIRSGGVQ
jgi:hypothetical protein